MENGVVKVNNFNFSDKAIKENNKKFLERIAYFKSFGFDQIKARENIIKYIPKNKSILEIGTGKGYLAAMISNYSDQVVSIDISDDDRNIAVMNILHADPSSTVDLITDNAEKLSLLSRSFDVVVSAYCFHHLERPFAVVKEMIRIAKEKIVVADFNTQGISLIQKIHASEERIHEKKSGDFSIVGEYIRQHGFDVKKHEDSIQVIYECIHNREK
jgi:ubiquinone/menaquinone biosynthesis C-methylase UbiE